MPVYNHTCAEVGNSGAGLCVMQHLWTGGSDTPATLYTQYRVRYYIDGEATASVNIPVGFGAGEPYGDDDGPWSAGSAFGKTGEPSGLFNSFPIPFAKSINITVEIVQGGKPGSLTSGGFWIIVRGRTLMAAQADELTFPLPGSAGVLLPHTARLKTVENSNVPVPGGATMALFNSTAARGAVYLVVLEVDALGGPSFLEGCFRYVHKQAAVACVFGPILMTDCL